MIGLLRINLGILLWRKLGVVLGYIHLPGVVICHWQYSHPSTLHTYWEEGWQDSSWFLGLRIIECRNSSDILEYRQKTSHLLLPIICKSGLDISRYLKLATILSLLDHLSHLHHHSLTGPFKASFLLSRKHAPFQCVINRRPSFLQHLAGCHNCLTRCRIQMFLKPQVCEEYGHRTREHQSLRIQVCLTSVSSELTRTGVTHSQTHPTKTKLSKIIS